MSQISWYQLSKEEISKTLRTDPRVGLSEDESILRLEEIGKNKLPEKKPFSKLKIFLKQFQSPLIYILLATSVVSFIINETTDAVVILITVLANSSIGYLQEKRAFKTLMALKKVVKYPAKVLRGNNLKIINSENLVPGDIIFLDPGYKVPADVRIIHSDGLYINEIMLTGEWIPSSKISRKISKKTFLSNRDNMAYMGTVVERGKGKAIVVNTGIQTEIGKIAKTVRETLEEKTPYQKKISNFARLITYIILALSSVIFIEGVINHIDIFEMFKSSIAIAISAIPEALPIAITIILSIGAKRILDKKGLVRQLSSAETLGSTSVICTDKTGTLTEGIMKVHNIIIPDFILGKKESIKDKVLSLRIGSIFSDAFIENKQDSTHLHPCSVFQECIQKC